MFRPIIAGYGSGRRHRDTMIHLLLSMSAPKEKSRVISINKEQRKSIFKFFMVRAEKIVKSNNDGESITLINDHKIIFEVV